MAAALLLPRILDRLPDRRVMLPAAVFLALVQLALAVLFLGTAWFGAQTYTTAAAGLAWPALLIGWGLLGVGYSAIMTPTGRLLRRSAQPADRPAVFAAQFALSHACWLLTYPLAGWLGSAGGIPMTLVVMGALTLLGAGLAAWLWPAADPEVIEHEHSELAPDDPHLRGQNRGRRRDDRRHAHAFVIDELHRHWPARATSRRP